MDPLPTTRDACEALDAVDPLAVFRDRFHLPEGVIYLDGNSLGPLPKTVPGRLEAVIRREWGEDLIRSWDLHGWIELPRRVGAKIARLLGAGEDEVVVTDGTSINLFKVLAAALALRPGRRLILTVEGNFPSDLYMMEGLVSLMGNRELRRVPARDGEDLDDVLLRILEEEGEQVAALCLTHVNYQTGAVHDMAALTAAAHRAGALAIWDLAHSAGALPVDLGGCEADFAVGCGYKFLCGGPGAPGFVYAARRHQRQARQPLSGWLGHAEPFAFEGSYRPADGIDRFVCGTPPILSLAALEEGVEVLLAADLEAVRSKSIALGDLMLARVAARCSEVSDLVAASPRDGARRGSQVSLRHPQAWAVMEALIARGVIGDFRQPDVLRFGLTPLTLRHAEVWDAVEVLAEVLERREKASEGGTSPPSRRQLS